MHNDEILGECVPSEIFFILPSSSIEADLK